MKILIDLQGAQGFGSNRGIGKYSMNISRSLAQDFGRKLDLYVLLNFSVKEGLNDLLTEINNFCPTEKVISFFVPRGGNCFNKRWVAQAMINKGVAIDHVRPDLVIHTSMFEPQDSILVPGFDPEDGYKHATILYDLIPFLSPEIYLSTMQKRCWYEDSMKTLKRSDFIFTISNYTRKKFIESFPLINPERVSVIGSATEKKLTAKGVQKRRFSRSPLGFSDNKILKKFNLEKSFILTVSGEDSRKNLPTLLRAYLGLNQSIKKNYQLIVVGAFSKGSIDKFSKQIADETNNSARILFTGYVSDEELATLYSFCTLFVFPSVHEGFGLPILEAMAMGAPCLVSEASSLPEVAGNAAQFFDSLDHHDLSGKISALISNETLLVRLSQKGIERSAKFSWKFVSGKLLEVLNSHSCKNVLQEKKGLDGKSVIPRQKLAYISPLPPEKSGVANYSSDLLQNLKKFYEIHLILIVQYKVEERPKNLDEFVCVSVDQFKASYSTYDRILYHFGNSSFHLSYFDLLRMCPGVVVLHDFYLDGVVSMLPDSYERVYDAHGLVGVYSMFRGLTNQPLYPCNLEVLDLAQGIIVHSEFARSLLENWYGKRVYEKSAVVPFSCSSTNVFTVGSQSTQPESAELIICSFGYLGPSKLNHRLFEAWVESVSDCSVLVFVGAEGNKEYCDVLREKIVSSGCSEKVFFTGWVSDKDYLNWMKKATLSVQLRTNSRGETSASLFDCFSNGVPSIINRHGDMGSLPSTIALAVQDEFTKEELGVALKTLLDSNELREYYSENARIYIEENHRPEKCADKYFSTLESLYGNSRGNLIRKLLELSKNNLLPDTKVEMDSFLKSLLKTTLPTYRKKTLFIDLSEIVKGDIRTGIQRVVRNILRALVENNGGSDGLRIEPIYSVGKGTNYVCAARFFSRLFGLPHTMEEKEVEFKRGDIFLGLDLQPLIVPEQKQLLLNMQARGIRIHFVVYDILPLTHREYFSPGVYNHFFRWFETITNFEKLICISETTKKEVEFFLRAFFPERQKKIKLESFVLGNKLPEEDLSRGVPKKADEIREIANRGNLFLVVGTLEPRKGHASVLDLADTLWSKNDEASFLFIGKRGWEVDGLIKRIKGHQQYEQKLFWMERCSDEFLVELYKASTGLLAASFAEGYSLPIVEAQYFGLPVLARELPIYREVAEKYPAITFFPSHDKDALLDYFLRWRKGLKGKNRVRKLAGKEICWKKATKDLQKIIID